MMEYQLPCLMTPEFFFVPRVEPAVPQVLSDSAVTAEATFHNDWRHQVTSSDIN